MKDFTLKAYGHYIDLILKSGIPFLRFDEFMSMTAKPKRFCLLRHDVDRKPINALNMAKLEAQKGVKATYYFRTKNNTLKPAIIKEIHALGHEIGYHYESLSDADGDIKLAIKDFETNLAKLRAIVPISTCSMHGRPLKPYDNRDIWRIKENHELLKSKFKIIGEVYLDINYSDIAYINDTGRNWTSTLSNRRDKVESNIKADFNSQEELIKYFENEIDDKLVFQIHPERWSDEFLEWNIQSLKDKTINFLKTTLR